MKQSLHESNEQMKSYKKDCAESSSEVEALKKEITALKEKEQVFCVMML